MGTYFDLAPTTNGMYHESSYTFNVDFHVGFGTTPHDIHMADAINDGKIDITIYEEVNGYQCSDDSFQMLAVDKSQR